MYFLYGKRRNGSAELVAKFGSEQQLTAYVRYATLNVNEDGTYSFEQKTPLAGCIGYTFSSEAPEAEQTADVPYNPTPTML
jgi:hypothetical protein